MASHEVAVVVFWGVVLAMLQEACSSFIEDPANTTCTLGRSFLIQCRPPATAATNRWAYNGSVVNFHSPPEGLTPTSSDGVFNMELTCVPQRHFTTIQCISIMVTRFPMTTEQGSKIATIKVQGMPGVVEHLRNTSYPSAILLEWDPLPSNTTYCVTVSTVANFTEYERNETCGLTDLQYWWYRDDAIVNDYLDSDLTVFYVFSVSGSNTLGRGPSSQFLETNFFSGRPNVITDMNSTYLSGRTVFAWSSFGPNISYCIQIINSSILAHVQEEVCGLEEPWFELNDTQNMTNSEDVAARWYMVVVTAVSKVGRGLPSRQFQVWVVPDVLNVTTTSMDRHYTQLRWYTDKMADSGSPVKIEITISIAAVMSVTLLLVIIIGILLILAMYFKLLHRHKDLITMDMSHCEAYESTGAQRESGGKMEDIFKEGENHYDSILNVAPLDPIYARIT